MTPLEQEVRKEQLRFYKRQNMPYNGFKLGGIAFGACVIIMAVLAVIFAVTRWLPGDSLWK